MVEEGGGRVCFEKKLAAQLGLEGLAGQVLVSVQKL